MLVPYILGVSGDMLDAEQIRRVACVVEILDECGLIVVQ
jgi:hypothetical protein